MAIHAQCIVLVNTTMPVTQLLGKNSVGKVNMQLQGMGGNSNYVYTIVIALVFVFTGYSGRVCSQYDPCSLVTCVHGQCRRNGNQGACQCDAGMTMPLSCFSHG